MHTPCDHAYTLRSTAPEGRRMRALFPRPRHPSSLSRSRYGEREVLGIATATPNRQRRPGGGGAPTAAEGVRGESLPQLQDRLCRAVEAEWREQKRAQEAAMSASSLSRLRSEGLVLTHLLATPAGRVYDEFLWRLEQRDSSGRAVGGSGDGGPELPYHTFQHGDSVVLSSGSGGGRGGGEGRRESLDATVYGVQVGGCLILRGWVWGCACFPGVGVGGKAGDLSVVSGSEPLQCRPIKLSPPLPPLPPSPLPPAFAHPLPNTHTHTHTHTHTQSLPCSATASPSPSLAQRISSWSPMARCACCGSSTRA
jgi:hypothetical protein